MPSGFRIAATAFLPRGRSGRFLEAAQNGHLVRASIRYAVIETGDRRDYRTNDPDGDDVILEAVARSLLAQLQFADTGPAGTVTLGGREVARRRGKSGAYLLSLDAWCLARGAELTKNPGTGFGRFTVGGSTVIVPLASDEVKVGEQKGRLATPVVQDDGEWYLDEALLQSLTH